MTTWRTIIALGLLMLAVLTTGCMNAEPARSLAPSVEAANKGIIPGAASETKKETLQNGATTTGQNGAPASGAPTNRGPVTTTNSGPAKVESVPTDTILKTGQIGVFENVDNGTKVIDIWAPTLKMEWKVGKFGLIHHNAWIGYANEADAVKGACAQVEERLSEIGPGMWAAGYKVLFNGQENAKEKACGQSSAPVVAAPAAPVVAHIAPTGSTTIQAARGGIKLPAGTLVVKETVRNDDRTINVEVGTLSEETRFAPYGSVHINGWWGYGSLAKAMEDGCIEAQERASEAGIARSWNQGYTVTFEGKPVPDVCVPDAPSVPATPKVIGK